MLFIDISQSCKMEDNNFSNRWILEYAGQELFKQFSSGRVRWTWVHQYLQDVPLTVDQNFSYVSQYRLLIELMYKLSTLKTGRSSVSEGPGL